MVHSGVMTRVGKMHVLIRTDTADNRKYILNQWETLCLSTGPITGCKPQVLEEFHT